MGQSVMGQCHGCGNEDGEPHLRDRSRLAGIDGVEIDSHPSSPIAPPPPVLRSPSKMSSMSVSDLPRLGSKELQAVPVPIAISAFDQEDSNDMSPHKLELGFSPPEQVVRETTASSNGRDSDPNGRGRRPSMDLLLLVDRGVRKLKKSVATGAGPTVAEQKRGVYIRTVYEFYDPMSRELRRRKMQQDVIHERIASKGSVPRDADDNRLEAASESGSGSDSGPDLEAPTVQNLGLRRGSLSSEGRVPRSRDQFATNHNVVTNWGVLAGKLLAGTCCLKTVLDTAGEKKRLKDVAADKRSVVPTSVRERANLVLLKARRLARTVFNEETDVLHEEWGVRPLRYLFGNDPEDTLVILTKAVLKILQSQSTVVDVPTPCKVFGDIHGQLRDLLYLWEIYGFPGETGSPSFVFNGDFVDRGRDQLEVLGVWLALKVAHPTSIALVRGNHEDDAMNKKYGFYEACRSCLKPSLVEKVYGMFQEVFNMLPFACLIGGQILTVHGGIGTGSWNVSDLRNVKRPLTSADLSRSQNNWLYNILWSDPIEDDCEHLGHAYGVHQSPRGSHANQFSWNVTQTFCARNGLGLVIRSHQVVEGGRGFSIMHSKRLVRVFSARDYEDNGNDCAILHIAQEALSVPTVPTGPTTYWLYRWWESAAGETCGPFDGVTMQGWQDSKLFVDNEADAIRCTEGGQPLEGEKWQPADQAAFLRESGDAAISVPLKREKSRDAVVAKSQTIISVKAQVMGCIAKTQGIFMGRRPSKPVAARSPGIGDSGSGRQSSPKEAATLGRQSSPKEQRRSPPGSPRNETRGTRLPEVRRNSKPRAPSNGSSERIPSKNSSERRPSKGGSDRKGSGKTAGSPPSSRAGSPGSSGRVLVSKVR